MFEYTDSYLKPFSWAKAAYDYTLGLSSVDKINIKPEDLTTPSLPDISSLPITIKTDSDWNGTSKNQVALLGAIFQSADQAEEYFNSIYSLISSRVSESERRVQELDSSLRVLLSNSRTVATTSTHLKGGDTTLLETSDKYYRTFGPLAAVPSEGIFRLKDTGAFSSIRSLGGFAGQAVIENSLGQVLENGVLGAITDGARNTFWTGTFYSPAPIRADQNDVPWLPDEYKHGLAFQVTYYLDRATLVTEVFVDPVTTEPMDLVSISWTPSDIGNALTYSTFSTTGWTFSGSSMISGSYLLCTDEGYASQTFALPGNYLSDSATSMVSTGRRAQLHYELRGLGDLYAGVRLIWYNSSGSIIGHKIQEDYPTGFFSNHRVVDTIPQGATSGRVDFGVFTPIGTPASAFFNSPVLYLGERSFQCDEVIDQAKTISLPEIVKSSRFSFVFAQRNPRRELVSVETSNIQVTPIQGLLDIDSVLQKATQDIAADLLDSGPGQSLFAYRVGMKELDLRYRAHVPRGAIVSLPLFSTKEIREIWVTAEIGQFYNDNTKFYIYPFADDPEQKTDIIPFRMGNIDNATSTSLQPGEILRIYTFEEQSSGWYDPADKAYITNPRDITERFEGTDREGKIKLGYAPHLRRPYIADIQTWLDKYSIWPAVIDPNLETIYGLPESSQSTINSIREGNLNAELDLNDLISRPGYLPIRVTIQTDKWTAQPDIYGRPDISKVRTIRAEELTSTTVVQTTVEQEQSVISFEAWLNSTDAKTFMANMGPTSQWIGTGIDNYLGSQIIKPGNRDKTLRQILDGIQSPIPENTTQTNRNIERYRAQLLNVYNRLKNQGKVPIDTSLTNTITSAVEADDVYSTRFKPIITGPNGSFLRVYWYNPTDNTYLAAPQSSYEVANAGLGLIKVLSAGPSGFTSLIADYQYITNSTTEDHFSSVLDFATMAATGVSDISSQFQLRTKPLPITRNMTDYVNGRIPILRPPNFERLSKDYYPVIEYYVNSNGELIFSRDFFKYGDIPANIRVEYSSLAISPRVGVQITRSGSPAATPTIYNVSLRVREGSSSPIRETS